MMEIEEGTGTEDVDAELLAKDKKARFQPKVEEQLDWYISPNQLSIREFTTLFTF